MAPLGVRVDSLRLSLMEEKPVLGSKLAELVVGAGVGALSDL